MSDFALNMQETPDDTDEPQATFILTDGEREVFRREARVFSGEDLIAVSDEVTRVGGLSQSDVDQYLAELIEPVRIKWLRSRERQPDEVPAEGPQGGVPRYLAVLPDASGGGAREASIRDVAGGR